MNALRLLLTLWPLLIFNLLIPTMAWSQETGVQHRIDASVTIDPEAPLLSDMPGAVGGIAFTVRLSANSKESRFFALLSPAFSGLRLAADKLDLVDQTKIWEEGVCHQRRGLPKVTVTSVTGGFEGNGRKREVKSDLRRVGVRISDDDLTAGIKLPPGSDAVGSFYAVRAQSKLTKLNVDLKIYAFPCVLDAKELRPASNPVTVDEWDGR
jgi:hypothetical protein